MLGVDLDEPRIREHIRLGTEQRGGLHGVIRDEGRIVATIGAIQDRWWFSEAICFSVLWLYVHPAYRRRGYDAELIAWLKAIRDEISGEYGRRIVIVNGVISTRRLPAKLRLWQKSGPMVGGIFLIP